MQTIEIKNLDANKKINACIYGTGKNGQSTLNNLKKYDFINVMFFLDSLNAGKINDLKIVKIDDFSKYNAEIDYIFVASAFEDDIFEILDKKGFNDKSFKIIDSPEHDYSQNNFYKSCAFIEGSLIMHPRNFYHCCIPVNGKFGSTMICEYTGGELPLSSIEDSRNHYRKMAKNLDDYPECHCNGCVNLVEYHWDNNYFFNNLHFNHSLLCSLNCNFCVQRKIATDRQIASYETLPICKEIVKKKLLDPAGYIFWAGGEPTIIKDFEESLDMMVEYGVGNEIATNSTVFSNAIHKNLGPYKKLSMKTSIDCGTRETFLKMKGKDSFDAVWANLTKYAATGGLVSAKYIISNDNVDIKDLEGFVYNVIKAKIKEVYVDINHNFTTDEITKEHRLACAYLIKNLRNKNIECTVGVHSTASAPDFLKEVEALMSNK